MLKITKTLKWIEYLEDFLITMRTATFWECFLHAYLSYSSNTFLKLKLPLSSFIGKKMHQEKHPKGHLPNWKVFVPTQSTWDSLCHTN